MMASVIACDSGVMTFRFQKLMVEVFPAMRVHVVEMDQVSLQKLTTLCLKKRATFLTDCNFVIRPPILIIFGG